MHTHTLFFKGINIEIEVSATCFFYSAIYLGALLITVPRDILHSFFNYCIIFHDLEIF